MPILDTCFVIDVLDGDPKAAAVLDLVRKGSAPVGVSPYTHFELYAGVGRSRNPQGEAQLVEEFLSALTVFPFSSEAARQAGLMDAHLASQGKAVSLVDLFIAAIAIHEGQDLVTRNVKDFRAIPGLRVLAY